MKSTTTCMAKYSSKVQNTSSGAKYEVQDNDGNIVALAFDKKIASKIVNVLNAANDLA